MIATGSALGTATRTSPVATLRTQSDEPARLTSSISMPRSLYQPSLVATANGTTPSVSTLVHQPMRTLVGACAADGWLAQTAAVASVATKKARVERKVMTSSRFQYLRVGRALFI